MGGQMNKNLGKVFVGTSGYSYSEWITAGFYPHGTQRRGMLPLYAGVFSITELNYTWYQMPRASMIERQLQLVPPDFQFAAKLTRTLTHEVDSNAWRKEALVFRSGITPLLQTRQLAAVLVQLPPSFGYSAANRHYLAALLEELAGLPLAVEFRHPGWAVEKVFDELARRKVTLVAVDEPDLPWLFPVLDAVTNPDLVYIRFHGRNAKGWRSGNMQLQFDYNYSNEELHEWVKTRIINMASQARQSLIFFNNHVRGQAASNALAMRKVLAEHGLTAG